MTPKIPVNKIIIIVLLTLILTLGCGCLFYPDTDQDELNLVRVKITTVIDGDTAYALFPDGREEKVRFIGVDAPEINHPVKGREPYGNEAELYTRSELESRYLWLEFDQSELDQYGRLLAYLWLSSPEKLVDSEIREKMFNARLIIDGYAVQVVFPPNIKYADFFAIYEAEAQAAGRGLWSPNENK
jgi:micrococcal nuclease